MRQDYTYNSNNQLVTMTTAGKTTRFFYDRNGNQIRKVTPGEGVAHFAYDALNRMTEWRKTGDGKPKVEQHIYRGAEWHRCGMVVQDGDSPAERVAFLYDGDNVCADIVNAAGALTVSRFYVTPFLDQNLFMTDFAADGAKMYCYSQDGLGSVRTLTDKAGEVVNKYDYTAFGEKWTAGTSEGVGQRYAYTGREVNPSSGMVDLRYRGYDPVTGIFLQRDPLWSKGIPIPAEVMKTMPETVLSQLHLYSYCGQSPTRFIDTFGLARNYWCDVDCDVNYDKCLKGCMVPFLDCAVSAVGVGVLTQAGNQGLKKVMGDLIANAVKRGALSSSVGAVFPPAALLNAIAGGAITAWHLSSCFEILNTMEESCTNALNVCRRNKERFGKCCD